MSTKPSTPSPAPNPPTAFDRLRGLAARINPYRLACWLLVAPIGLELVAIITVALARIRYDYPVLAQYFFALSGSAAMAAWLIAFVATCVHRFQRHRSENDPHYYAQRRRLLVLLVWAGFAIIVFLMIDVIINPQLPHFD